MEKGMLTGDAGRRHETPIADRPRLLAAIHELGVTERVAGELAGRYASAYLWRMVRQARYARRVGLAANPAGWFIASVRDDWPAPVGYDDWAELDAGERREALRQSWGVCRRCSSRPCRCARAAETSEVVSGKDEESY
jgi:hypothetical protein